ncbi:MAG: TOBE domain-containing protein, partial [Betaproteobacteria bacterium]
PWGEANEVRIGGITPPAGPPQGRGAPWGEANEVRVGGTSTDNHVRGNVADLLYMGDVTVYRVETSGGARVEALLANSQSGRAKFFEVGDAVEMSWAVGAGHFIAD